MLQIDFSYQYLQKPAFRDLAYPEVQLISLIVVATKLSQPFDDMVRLPINESDPTVVKMDWAGWRQVMSGRNQEGLKRGEESKVTDTDVLSMNKKELDDYLDWYQRAWIDDRDPKSMSTDPRRTSLALLLADTTS